VSLNGITAHAASAGASASIGAMKNSARLAPDGTTISLNSIFSTSANGCSRPIGPTRFGPMRTCIQPMILRSQYVRYATQRISGTAMTTTLTNVHTGVHHAPIAFCTGRSRSFMKSLYAFSTVTGPERPSSPHVDGCAAAMRTTPGGTAASICVASTASPRPWRILIWAPSSSPS
jgi:hypothetical protein